LRQGTNDEEAVYKNVNFFSMMGMALPGTTATDVPPTGKEIMTRVEDRPDGDDRKSVVTMTLINKSGRQRIREVESVSESFGRYRNNSQVWVKAKYSF
jgi:hypothetical protein